MIELVAVLVVMAILAAVAAPAALSLSAGRPAAAERQVVRDLAYARAHAMTTGRTTWVSFNVATDSYQVLIDDTITPGYASAAALTDPGTGKAMLVLLTRNEFKGTDLVSASFGGVAAVGFDSRGQPLKTDGTVLVAAGAVTLSGPHTITVATPTGYAVGD